ncbi:ferritin-like domain-containing protein [Spongiactinospora sp. TRM90649]|uniref:ferritin-like domain-containing protein n=1 Tax=Spongiactinospora sp. TRM90649 TaxID=3031114 RepID=UPI0023F9D557|nr:ferritin-like domain-containing protein [Spongiactinospora sp. TRM90649]MDF5753984.1 ferritin-like domain-containing protein [Spongiactinospora sp. TRM90649]
MSALTGLLKALAAEHAAVYAYGLIAARSSGTLRSSATRAYQAHRAERDRLRTMITERGGSPSEAEASYALPFTPGSASEATRLAALVENGVTAAYLELVATEEPAVRQRAARAVQESVIRAYGFHPEITALPGLRPGE